MSRAFVDEDAGSDETDGMHEIPLPLPTGARNYMTPEGAMRMADELRRLVEEERPRAAGALAAAESSNKAESLRTLSKIDRKISYLTRMKSMLEVVQAPSSLERAVFGLVVRVSEEPAAGDAISREGGGVFETGDILPLEMEYRIVGVDEIDLARGYVSWASPIAKALIGKRVGEMVLARLPLGERRMRILEIRYEESER
ncbi:MAG TPA: GreA/GreB family elongation factor [Rectinemataceae bacterium]|nr:GreA/GreB family elongation factor [Rectinemataceae bacterium]